ncbi:MAG: universal stress protein [Candidatus Marinimicrobia bacterium]|nr:universal stress protein [Candidatus Neomarinimicrobiota bacterium]MBL7031254.1 universal stress protein [Candidatus Neomarinimicrobiota bacterium]
MITIIVTTDFSKSARVAYTIAKTIAEKMDARIELIHVLNPNIMPPVYYQQLAVSTELGEVRLNLQKKLKKELNEYFSNYKNSGCHVLEGLPFKEIIQYAQKIEAFFIVMASHGHSAMNQLLFGSTVDKVVRKSSIPVLSVRDSDIHFELS